MQKDLKKEARQIFEAGLRAVDPNEAVKRSLTLEGKYAIAWRAKIGSG